ncbi:UNVERIFIED_CONTAM: hypothetical protein RMT77_014346 [Armadillidium vulgare]
MQFKGLIYGIVVLYFHLATLVVSHPQYDLNPRQDSSIPKEVLENEDFEKCTIECVAEGNIDELEAQRFTEEQKECGKKCIASVREGRSGFFEEDFFYQ